MSEDFAGGFVVGAVVAGVGAVLVLDAAVRDDVMLDDALSQPIKTLMDKGFLTEEQLKAAARKGISEVAEVASREFPSEVNGYSVDTKKLAQDAVEVYLAGDKKNPPVIAVPSAPAP